MHHEAASVNCMSPRSSAASQRAGTAGRARRCGRAGGARAALIAAAQALLGEDVVVVRSSRSRRAGG